MMKRIVILSSFLLLVPSCNEASKSIVPYPSVVATRSSAPLLIVAEQLADNNGLVTVGLTTVQRDGSFRYQASGLLGHRVVIDALSEPLTKSLRADIAAGVIYPGADGVPSYAVDLDASQVQPPPSIQALLNQVHREHPNRGEGN